MNILLDESEQDLSKFLCIRDDDGRPAVMIGLLATVFFEQPWTRAVREAVTDVAEGYIQQFRAHLRWAKHPKTAHMHPIDSRRVRFPREWLPQYQDGKGWSIGFHGGESEDAVSEFQISAFGSDNIRGMGFLQVYLPLCWFADYPGSIPAFVLKIGDRIKPLSGYGGIGVLEPMDISIRSKFQQIVRQIAERFPGLEIESRIAHTIHVGEGIKGVNWLTLLGDRWIQEIGGVDSLRARLGDDFKLTPYDGGLMIQAGPKPQIGDVRANRWPRHYVTLAKVLKPIQIKKHYPFHFGDPMGSLRMDSEASMAWVFRFDGK